MLIAIKNNKLAWHTQQDLPRTLCHYLSSEAQCLNEAKGQWEADTGSAHLPVHTTKRASDCSLCNN